MNSIVSIVKEVQALLAQIGRSLEGVTAKTIQRWDRSENLPSPDAASRVAKSHWKIVSSQEGNRIRQPVFDAIRQSIPTAPVDSWKTEEEFGAWFYRLAEGSSAGSSIPAAGTSDAPQPASPSQSNPVTPGLTALKPYFEALIKECAPLKLKAIDQAAAGAGKEPLGLRNVYVDLNVDLSIPSELSLAKYLESSRRGAGEFRLTLRKGAAFLSGAA